MSRSPGPVRIKLTPGILGKFGYASNLSALKRRQALAKAIVARGKEKAIDRRAAALSIFRRLNVLVLYRKNAPPSKAKSAFEADKAWVKKTYLSPPRMKKRAAAKAPAKKAPAKRAKKRAAAKAPAKRGNGQQVFQFGRKRTPKPKEPSQLERWNLRNIKAREQEEEAIAAKQAALNEKKRLAEERERKVMELNRLALAAANQNTTREVMDTSRNREPQYTGPGLYNATLNWLTGGPTNKHWSK